MRDMSNPTVRNRHANAYGFLAHCALTLSSVERSHGRTSDEYVAAEQRMKQVRAGFRTALETLEAAP